MQDVFLWLVLVFGIVTALLSRRRNEARRREREELRHIVNRERFFFRPRLGAGRDVFAAGLSAGVELPDDSCAESSRSLRRAAERKMAANR